MWSAGTGRVVIPPHLDCGRGHHLRGGFGHADGTERLVRSPWDLRSPARRCAMKRNRASSDRIACAMRCSAKPKLCPGALGGGPECLRAASMAGFQRGIRRNSITRFSFRRLGVVCGTSEWCEKGLTHQRGNSPARRRCHRAYTRPCGLAMEV